MAERQTHRLVVLSLGLTVVGAAVLVAPPAEVLGTLLALAGVGLAYVCFAVSIETTARAGLKGIAAALTAPPAMLASVWVLGALALLPYSAALPPVVSAAHMAVLGLWLAVLWIARAAVDSAVEASASAAKGETGLSWVKRSTRALAQVGAMHPLSERIARCERRLLHAPLRPFEDPETAVAFEAAIDALVQALSAEPEAAARHLANLEQLLDERGL
jgi:hypothetical protein